MELQKNSECDRLAERLTTLKSQGVVDCKFFLAHKKEALAEDACREAADMLEAASSEFEVVQFNDAPVAI